MPLYTRLPDEVETVDIIVAGGGTAGCVLAARVAEADPSLSILVIEQGINNYNLPQVIYPALFPQNLLQDSKTALFWQGNQSSELANRAPIVPSGGTLGGGSSINWMVYTRAQRSDFDSWNTPGWSAEELWPYLKKFETYHGRGEREHHGYSGPINISSGTFRAKRAEDDFIDAAAQLGYSELKDLQNLDANNATERWLRYVGLDGKRQDAAHRFIHPMLQSGGYPNLHVLVENQLIRVLVDENKPTSRPCEPQRRSFLSAGANGTPLILERSGIGDPNVLKRVGVPLVEALPGVGNEYQDHHLKCINGFQDGRWDVYEAIRRNDELLGWNSMDASGKFRPTERDVDALGPAFRKFWDKHFKNAPDRPLMIIALYLAFFGDHATLPDSAEYVSLACWTAYPESRRSIHIKKPFISNEYPNPVDFDVGYLNDVDSVDVKKHIWSYKLQREMFRRMSIYRGELASSHPSFPRGSKAAVVERANGPVSDDTPKIEYTEEDDRAIEQKVRETVSTTWHSLGTCKMAPREKGGVVDKNLNVYGIRGLKLADLSIPPENVGANTNNTA
ncbi:GMC oxidoreductase [Zasmidium cellare ATCC 36951]|uniref:GMC oxidoreductase n=1 Tax=Zasmidium cellare ATCC 36951 TaxID=1080233 RepID=A0A6A6C4Q7_ZASCE|nr:GMC oxidoreductase [Zasmidium cellare ATCC 36951]KAF2161913.1 GMC oxidoreductase [Zasmidium cellare ATCC 36951]